VIKGAALQLNGVDAEGKRKSEFESGFRKIEDNCGIISVLLISKPLCAKKLSVSYGV
jgi:hypothetical protein